MVRGYSDDEVMKILGGTWLRYLKMIGGDSVFSSPYF